MNRLGYGLMMMKKCAQVFFVSAAEALGAAEVECVCLFSAFVSSSEDDVMLYCMDLGIHKNCRNRNVLYWAASAPLEWYLSVLFVEQCASATI